MITKLGLALGGLVAIGIVFILVLKALSSGASSPTQPAVSLASPEGSASPVLATTPTPLQTASPVATQTQTLAATSPTPASDATEVATDPPGIYTVRAGDTLLKIAATTGVSLQDLLAANRGVNPTGLHIGQQLRLQATVGTAADEGDQQRPSQSSATVRPAPTATATPPPRAVTPSNSAAVRSTLPPAAPR